MNPDRVVTIEDLKRFLIEELQKRNFKPREVNAMLPKILGNTKTNDQVSQFMKGFMEEKKNR